MHVGKLRGKIDP